MYIVYDTNNSLDSLRSKYLVLELDTVEFLDGKTVKAFAVIDSDHIPLNEITKVPGYEKLHGELLMNYRRQDWEACRMSIKHLRGQFKGELDSFYDIIEKRIAVLETTNLADDWTGNILTKQTDSSA